MGPNGVHIKGFHCIHVFPRAHPNSLEVFCLFSSLSALTFKPASLERVWLMSVSSSWQSRRGEEKEGDENDLREGAVDWVGGVE